MQIQVVLHNIRSTYNVGAILRTMDGLGIETAVFSGITPRYNDEKLLPHLRTKLNRQIAKSALGAENYVQQKHVDDLPTYLEKQRADGWQIIGLENNLSPEEESKKIILGAESIIDVQLKKIPSRNFQSERPVKTGARMGCTEMIDSATRIILILGEEVNGIPSEIRSHLDYFLEIPMHGRKESFNVSIAAAIALWELSCYNS